MVLSFAFMQVSGHELSSEHDAVGVMVYRSLVGVVLMLPIALAFGGTKTRKSPPHRLRRSGEEVDGISEPIGVSPLLAGRWPMV